MSKTFNMVGGGGGKAALDITVTNGTATSVTATKDGSSISLIQTGGAWFAVLPSFGTWTVSATDGTRSQTDTVNASVAGLYTLTLRLQDVPNAYTQLEYIQSTNSGTQYINTGYVPTSSTKVETSVMLLSTTNYEALFGAKGHSFCIQRIDIQGYLYAEIFGGEYQNREYLIAISNNTKITASLTGTGTFTKDGVTKNLTPGTATPLTPIWLFAKEAANSTSPDVVGSQQRHYSDKIYDGDTLVRNMIPAKRSSDSVVGMYDTVNDVFYTNAGTGSFTAGPAA